MARSGVARPPVGAILGAVSFVLCSATVAVAQAYPTGPVKVAVPFGAGGATDL